MRETGAPQRIHRYSDLSGPVADRMSSFGYGSATAAPIKLGAEVWGALVAAGARGEPLPTGAERQLEDFAELVALALANADAYRKLADSRARIVEAADGERRRLERNLHDGAQQRLVSLALQLRLMEPTIRSDPAATESLLVQSEGELKQAFGELRELARGIHPSMLTRHGLRTALDALAERAPLPVHHIRIPAERLPEPVEVAIYYLVAEAITNVAKYVIRSAAVVVCRKQAQRSTPAGISLLTSTFAPRTSCSRYATQSASSAPASQANTGARSSPTDTPTDSSQLSPTRAGSPLSSRRSTAVPAST